MELLATSRTKIYYEARTTQKFHFKYCEYYINKHDSNVHRKTQSSYTK